MKKFEILEQYQKQNEGVEAIKRKYFEKVVEAEKTLNKAKIELDELMHLEIMTGTDKSKEKAQVIDKIAKADSELTQARSENEKAFTYLSSIAGDIKASDVVQAYLNEYLPEVRAEHMPSIKERIQQANDLMLSAFHDFYQLKREHRDLRDEIVLLDQHAQRGGEQQGTHYVANPFDLDEQTGMDLPELRRQLMLIQDGNGFGAKVNYIEKPFGGK